MQRNIPVPGSFYRHFKGNLYQVKMIARDSETQEKMVVYQAMYPPFEIWVRPLAMFMEEVDQMEYPAVKQKFRFEEVHIDEIKEYDGQKEYVGKAGKTMSEADSTGQKMTISDEEMRKIFLSGQPEKYLSGKMGREEIAHHGFMVFLDAETYRDKRQIYIGLKPYLDDRLLNNIAVALDIVLEEGSAEEHYDTILRCIETFEKYEAGGRLRR